MNELLKYYRQKQDEFNTEKVYETQCPFCSVQCTKNVIEERIVERKKYKVQPTLTNPVAEGRLCIKGMNAHQHAINTKRISYPMLKVDGEFERVSWSFALDYLKEKFTTIQQNKGKDAIAVYGGGSLTNEESYLLGKFARVALGTKYIDYNGRFCMSAAASASNAALGMDRGISNKMDEILNAKCIILAGTNIADCQPTLMPYFRKAKKNGAFIIVVDPRETGTTKIADLHLKVKPGMDANLINGILKVIFDKNLVDQSFIDNRTNGYEELKQFIDTINVENIASLADVSVEDITLAATKFGEAPTGMVYTARGVEQHSTGSDTVRNFINLILATGKIGKPGCGFGSITGQANGQGGREHGQKADQLPGYRSIENPEHRAYIADVWGVNESELPRKGVSAFEMMEKINQEEIHGLFVMGSNPVVSNPDATFVQHAFEKLKFLVVVDLYMSETARLADLILPTTSYLEDEGTITNFEGRVLLRTANRPKYAESKHDWEILCEVADVLGKGEYFKYETTEDVFNELRIATKGGVADYYGITYDRLKKQSLFWPCPDTEHEGTVSLFEEKFEHADGKANFTPVTEKHPKESRSADYPLTLTNGRVMHHYLSGVQTRNSTGLMSKYSEPLLEIHPDTAMQYNIVDGGLVKVVSKRGKIILRSKFTTGIRQDTLFTSFHWGDLQSVNRLTNPVLDPICKMPEFKVSAVNIFPI